MIYMYVSNLLSLSPQKLINSVVNTTLDNNRLYNPTVPKSDKNSRFTLLCNDFEFDFTCLRKTYFTVIRFWKKFAAAV